MSRKQHVEWITPLVFLALALASCVSVGTAEDLAILEYREVSDFRAQQGITSDGANFFVSKGAWGDLLGFSERISKYSVSRWSYVTDVDADLPSNATHVGDISAGPSYVYAAVDDSFLESQDAGFAAISTYSRGDLTYDGYWDITSYSGGAAIAGVDYYHNNLYVVNYRKDDPTSILEFSMSGSMLTYQGSYDIGTRKVNGIEFYGNYGPSQ